MRIRPPLFSALAACALLVACGSPATPPGGGQDSDLEAAYRTGTILDRYENLSGRPLYDPQQGNCIAHELGTPGQGFHTIGSGFHTIGSVGGFTASPSGAVVRPEEIGAMLDADFGESEGARDVAIVVADDFGGAFYALGEDLFHMKVPTVAAVEKLMANGELSHGALVVNHVHAVLDGHRSYEMVDVRREGTTWVHRDTGARLIVRVVDVEDFDTSVLADRIRAALWDLSRDGVDHVAVNMSFAIIPCSIVDDFVANLGSFETMDDYVTAVTGEPEGARNHEAVLTAIAELAENDPLGGLAADPDIAGLPGERTFVASSGNFARDYEMYPAAWDFVLGVGASDAGDPARRAGFSNAGEVLHPGAWFVVTNDGARPKIHGHGEPESRVAYAGTSFSAPQVAAFAALDYAMEQPRCGVDPAGVPYLAHGGVSDTPLRDAVRAFCPNP